MIQLSQLCTESMMGKLRYNVGTVIWKFTLVQKTNINALICGINYQEINASLYPNMETKKWHSYRSINMCFLNDLPINHPDRNRPLFGCWYRWKNGKTWKEIKKTFRIAGNSFNDLGPAWTDNDVFTFKKPNT